MKNNFEDKGIILKKTLIKEKGAFFTIFTYKSGKQSFFISNIKKSKNIFSSYLSIGNEIFFKFTLRNKSLYIKDVKIIKFTKSIGYDQLTILSYILKLTNLITFENQSNLDLYTILQDSLYSLIENKSLSRICLAFEIKLLTILGFLNKLNIYVDSDEKIDLSVNNLMSSNHGGIIKLNKNNEFLLNAINNKINNNACTVPLIGSEIKILNYMQSGQYTYIFKIKIPFIFFKKNQLIFKKILFEHLPSKMDINPCFLSENVLE